MKQISQTESLLKVAVEILSESPNKEQHVEDIAGRAISQNKNLGLSREILKDKLAAVLNANAKSKSPKVNKVKNKDGSFHRGYYKLKRTAMQPSVKIQKIKVPSVPTNFSGMAGEYAVASQLLFWGIDVSKPAVDIGIDWVAIYKKDIQYIQVKTACTQDACNTFTLKVDKEPFKRTSELKPHYIFVLRSGQDIVYAVIPYSQMELWIRNNKLPGKDAYSVKIERDEKRQRYTICGEDVNCYINNFKIFELPIH